MSQSVSTLAPLDGEQRDAEPRTGEGSSPKSACSCAKCGLYRWYPPLMLLSTVLAGVFCWMYITKPVFLTQPREGAPADAQPAFQESAPGAGPELSEPPTAESGGGLDPVIAGLPGESKRPLQGDLISNGILSNGLQPMRVERDGPSLFIPATPPSSAEKKKPLVVTVAPVPEKNEEPAAEPEAEAGTEASASEEATVANAEGAPDSPPSAQSSEGEDYRPPASFMAEFAAVPKAPPATAVENSPSD